MSANETKTALVTGATSGLGFEASAQLAGLGYGTVIVTGRNKQKAENASAALVARTGAEVFETLALDNDDLATVEAAAATLVAEGREIDVLILNAGIAPPAKPVINKDGLESTVASSLVGHHLLTMRLIEADLLAENARIVIAGSEAARGDVPMFHPVDIDEFANKEYSGDRQAAIEAYMKMDPPARYKSGDAYATAKQFVAWWAAELATLLPAGSAVNVVSPGSTPETKADRHMGFVMKNLMVPFFRLVPGMSHSVADGAGRYLEAVDYPAEVSGQFFASPHKKMVGPLTEIHLEHLERPESQKALWGAVSKVTGGFGYPIAS
jgi:NAD(P)-dependent dehydrogenase (short-subunit alcohol dehydrogenase family)